VPAGGPRELRQRAGGGDRRTGRDGQVGARLAQALAPIGTVLATSRRELDLADADALRQHVRDARPDVIVNAAAYTAVDKAETETELASAVNAVAPGILAEEAKRLGALLVHYSTDYVFSGEANAPYKEGDATAPLSVYGRTKLDGEERIRSSGCRHLILRTSWVYDTRGRNFLLTILKRARAGETLRVVGDQQGVPNWSAMIARATAACIERGGEGLFHLSAAGQTSWHGFERYDFLMDEKTFAVTPAVKGVKAGKGQRPCIVVVPKTAAPGNPWSWQACYWDHEPQTEVELLKRGFHIVFITPDGGVEGRDKAWDAWYKYLTEKHGLAKKAAFVGMSKGGVNEYSWGVVNPEKVACIYADNPALWDEDFAKLAALAKHNVPLLPVSL